MSAGTEDAILELDSVSRDYGSKPVVMPLSLELRHGDRVGLLGPNGAGKTTLMSLMACILAPTMGRVVVAGRPVLSRSDVRVARREIGFLPQNPSSVPAFTAIETVEYAAWLKGVGSKSRAREAKQLLERVGLGEAQSKTMRTLSGGMVQRVHLAASLTGAPSVVLLDEPTVGLDPAQRLEFRSLILALEQTAVVLSTHLVEDIAAIASSVKVLDAGAVLFSGTPGQLVAAGEPGAPGDTDMERGYMSVLASSATASQS